MELCSESNITSASVFSNVTAKAAGQLGESPEQQQWLGTTLYMWAVTALVLCSLGLVANLFCFVVLHRPSLCSSTYSYLSALAACDFCFLGSTVVLLFRDIGGDKPVWPLVAFPYVHGLAFTLQVISVWVTLAFTVDRYLMICFPLHAPPYCTIRRARQCLAVIATTAFLFNVPKFLEYRCVRIVVAGTNVMYVGLTSLGQSALYRQIYHSWLYLLLVSGVPLALLAVLNFRLILTVRNSHQRGVQLTPSGLTTRRHDTTVMLISVVIVFFVCQFPALVSRVIWAFGSQLTLQHRHYTFFNELANILVIANALLNVIPYFLFGRKFRHEVKIMFGCGSGERQEVLVMREISDAK